MHLKIQKRKLIAIQQKIEIEMAILQQIQQQAALESGLSKNSFH